MSAPKIEASFYLVGGQTVVIPMSFAEGETFDAGFLKRMAQEWRDIEKLWLAQKDEWSISIPYMKNVAMVVFRIVKPEA